MADDKKGCTHPNHAIHPNRFDGSVTVCHACQRQVVILTMHYASGKDEKVQFEEAQARLNTPAKT